MTISNELMEVYATAPTDVTYLETISLEHKNFKQKYYFVNDYKGWDFHLAKDDIKNGIPGARFEPFPFQIKLPSQERGSNQELTVALANAGLEMMDELEAAQQSPDSLIEIVYRVYLDKTESEPAINPPIVLHVTDVVADDTSIGMTANRFDILGRLFPKVFYDINLFAGLKR